MSDTDTDYTTDTDTDTDMENEYGDSYLYDVEEPSRTRYNIVLCELYNRKLYGDPGSRDVDACYLVMYRIKHLCHYVYDMASDFQDGYRALARENSPALNNHRLIRNYKNIVVRNGYIKPEIAQCIYLESGHCVCILKTFWLKIIQRVWQRVFAQRRRVFCLRCSPISIAVYVRTGSWPTECKRMPTLRGMLRL